MRSRSPQIVSALLTNLFVLGAVVPSSRAADLPKAAADFRKEIEPILDDYCYDCHADGEKKGNVSFDTFPSGEALAGDRDLWLAVLKNTRAGLMPPSKKPQPSADARQRLERWIKYEAFGIDPTQPDPGRVTVRRLNRVEYRNTIRDLMGIEFHSEVEFPPDDTGYGFDTIGDVLTISPILLEKYLAAAKAIVSEAVPLVSRVVPETKLEGSRFRRDGSEDAPPEARRNNRRESIRSLSYYEPAIVSAGFPIERAGDYQLLLDLAVRGNFDYDPGRCRVVFKLDDREILQKEFGWHDFKAFPLEFPQSLPPGDHRLTVELQPLTPVEQKINSLSLQLVSLTIRGPMAQEHWSRPPNYDRFFSGDAPETPEARRTEAARLLRTFASKAFRRPVDDHTVERLTALAESVYTQPGKTFEAGMAHAFVAVIASPRFLFRLEESAAHNGAQPIADVDEYSLASRLSYFLWSTMPDDELISLAAAGQLRANLPAQVRRLLADPRAENLVRNFIGQWLQVRDVDGISINARVVLARDRGEERDIAKRRIRIQELIAIPEAERTPEQKTELQSIFGRRRNNTPQLELDRDLRDAMQRETEMFLTHIMREDRSVTDLIDSDYTFLNEKLAGLYGVPGVTGNEMRKVTLPPDSPRGGVLTNGSVLVVTSNPDRTSPVKRGLFVLENFLGTPAPPPPANVPALEAAEKDFGDHQPTLREALELHREKPLCAGCHRRMDPIGLAFENFNAMGMFREKERQQAIDTAGELITGETFHGVRELKQILVAKHRPDFYRCLTEKLLTYALGRGLEYYDVETVDRIVERMEAGEGKFSVLLNGIIDSAPFQMQRTVAADSSDPSASEAQTQVASP